VPASGESDSLVSRVPPWILTAALYLVGVLSLVARAVPYWAGGVACGLWLAYLALQRDQTLAKEVLMTVLGVAPAVRLVGQVVGASFAAECWACAVLGTISVALVSTTRSRQLADERIARHFEPRRWDGPAR
jgi:hypothetical protein